MTCQQQFVVLHCTNISLASHFAQIQAQIRAAAAHLLEPGNDNQLTQQQETSLICQSAIHAMKQCDAMKQLMQSTLLLSDQVADAVQALASCSSNDRYLAPCTPPTHCISPLKLSSPSMDEGNYLHEWSLRQESPTMDGNNNQVMRACEKYSPQFL